MRRLLRKNTILAVLLLVGGLYFLSQLSFLVAGPARSSEQTLDESPLQSERLARKESWVDQGDYLPLNVSYQLLAGVPSNQRRFLSVGMSSINRKRGSYLIPTLESLFRESSPEERSSMVVVVLLADFDAGWKVATARKIKTAFATELEQGQLLVIHVLEEWYPPLTGLKRNYNDSQQRVSFRSKQNLDYSFLIHYSSGLAQYYLQLEDDVSSSKNFLTAIRRRVGEQEAQKTTWAMLEFSALGYIGKLYKSEHLPLLARFLFLFYQEMPCDWLMSHFRMLLTQKETIIFKPSLFQHMGTYSSFEGTYNKLKDNDFEEGFYANPAAEVYSNMSSYKEHLPKHAWEAGRGFFWGHAPQKGNYLTVVFTVPAVVTEIVVETGSEGKDLLESAQVELGHGVTIQKGEKSCKEFQSVGAVVSGRFEMHELHKTFNSASSCLRIQVTAGQKDWLIIKKIRIATERNSPPETNRGVTLHSVRND